MLKKITTDKVRLGMHLHALCGTWLDHPFWTTQFKLRDPAALAKLQASGVAECWIDTAKGLDVLAAPASIDVGTTVCAEPAGLSPQPAQAQQPIVDDPPVAPGRTSMQEELERAAVLFAQSRRAVQSLLGEARMGRALDASQCLPLVSDIAESVWRNSGALVSLARLKTHDDYSYMHSVAVCALMVSLAKQLGHDEAQAREAGLAGLMHDIGKAKMPLEVLNKPGKLTDAEYRLMQQHPERGHQLLGSTEGVSAVTLDVCLHHHERPDGRGYPHGLAGDAISLPARMGALCDVYDAITSNRPYKAGWDPADSVSKMAEWAKAGQFDPVLFQAFVKSLGIYPNGSLVRMTSGRLGVVVEQNPSALVSPHVKVFFSTRSSLPIPPEVIDLSDAACGDRIAGRESNRAWQFAHLDELWAGAETLRKIGQMR
ncbi:MAG: phosphodiesterase [Methylibium sp. NZG]|nr:MAG: phosphodiesterase [Methylibium sp. NZG]